MHLANLISPLFILFLIIYLCYGFNLNKCEVEHLQPSLLMLQVNLSFNEGKWTCAIKYPTLPDAMWCAKLFLEVFQ